MSVVTETRTCPCGATFRVASDAKHRLCLPCQRKAGDATHLAIITRLHGEFFAAMDGGRHSGHPTNAHEVIATLGDRLGPAGPERDALVAEMVADINRTPADPFRGAEKPMAHPGRFYGGDMQKALGTGRWAS